MRTPIALLSAAASLAWAPVASADPPATAGALQFGAGFRYGQDLEEGDANPWGTGIGLELGYTLPNAIYLGINAEYFLGDSQETPFGDSSANVWQVMAEGGYDIAAGPTVVVRPKLGLGIGALRSEVCPLDEKCESDSETSFAAAPGATFLYLGPSFSLGIDVRYAMLFLEEERGDALIFSVGFGF
jgi:hypothetical protein